MSTVYSLQFEGSQMNQKSLLASPCSYSPLINSYILFSLLTRISLCSVNPKFDACVPKSCGDGQNISFPFYILGVQPPFCGNPGFELYCGTGNDGIGHPILNLSGTEYVIREVFYNNHSLRVSNAAFSISSTNDCLALVNKSFTLDDNRFQLAPNQSDLFLLFGCDLQSLSEGLREHRVGCSKENKTDSVLGWRREDQDLKFVSRNCTGDVVTTKVEDGNGDIGEALRRGFVLDWTAPDCSECAGSGGKCGFDIGEAYAFRCYCTDRDHARKCDPVVKRSNLKAHLGIGLGIGLPSMLIIFGMLFLLHRRKHALSGSQFESRNSFSDPYSNPDLEGSSIYFEVPLFSYKDLKDATNNFDRARELGDGGFGTVYYGKLPDGREVAVKRLYEHNYRRVEQFMNEVEILTRLRHRNLVSLYGCTSRHSHELLLVYEYIPNGTVASHLHGDKAKPGLLPWSIRMKIAIETASALSYLHASDIIHRDVKTNNILLDNNYCVKVADFGLSRLFPNDVTHVSTAPQGTPGYVDPEYHQCYQLTSKSDVYSFGVVLIELISSMPAVDMNRDKDEINLSNLAMKKIQEGAFSELVDSSLGFESENEIKRKTVLVAKLAFQCLQRDTDTRPSMDEVLQVLRGVEGRKDEPEHAEEGHVHGARISHGNVHPPPPPSPDWDEVGLLKNIKPPPSPNTVTDKWESEATTPNASG